MDLSQEKYNTLKKQNAFQVSRAWHGSLIEAIDLSQERICLLKRGWLAMGA